MKIPALIFGSLLTSLAFGQTPADNAKLTDLFNLDQAVRQGKNVDWVKLSADDEKRRKEVHRMLDGGEVRTGGDYFHAALIFQHGQTPDDYLLAHVLAVDAISLGEKSARWLSAATLDRYLRSIWQPQIYGTQFQGGDGYPWTQEPIKSSLASDSIRAVVCVVPYAEQQRVLSEAKNSGKLESTGVPNCK